MFLSTAMKRVTWLGDGVSIAILKILSPESLFDPKTVSDILPIIRDSFSNVNAIRRESDRNPRITLFLLMHLGTEITDPGLREEINQTIKFVREQTTER